MSRARRVLVVAALVYLAASALPIAAAETNVAVGSKHTTASDFNAANDLSNSSVVGSGPSAVVRAQIGADAKLFDFSGATSTVSKAVTSQTTVPKGVAFEDRGRYMYVVGSETGSVYQFDLSTNFQVAPASINNSKNLNPDAVTGIDFNGDGTKMFIADNSGDRIVEYTLSKAWDISTASFTATAGVGGQINNLQGVEFNDDGTAFFAIDRGNDNIVEYSVSSAYDLSSTVSFVRTIDVGPQDTGPNGMAFAINGTRMYLAGAANDAVFEYELSTAYAPQTKTFIRSRSTDEPEGVAFNRSVPENRMFVVEDVNDQVDQFSLPVGMGSASYSSADHSVSNATTAWANVSLDNATANISVFKITGGTFDLVANSNVSTTGNHSLDLSGHESADTWRVNITFQNQSGSPTTAELHDEAIQFTNSHPQIDNASASPTGGTTTADSSPTLQIDTSDTTFSRPQGESVTVEFFVDGDSKGSTTLGKNGTASKQVSITLGGQHTWSVNATDEYGGSTPSQQFTFSTPANLTVRNESDPDDIIKPDEVTCTFYTLNGGLQNNLARRNTTTGNISLAGLPTADEFVVQCEAADWHTRTILLKSITSQANIYLINESTTTVDVKFSLEDTTGRFPESETRVQLERALNQSGNLSFRVVSGDIFGAAGTFRDTLVEDGRYRIIIENDAGDTRQLGPYTATDTETAVLKVGNLSFGVGGDAGYQWSANQTDSAVHFNYSDPDMNTTDLDVRIVERGNESNVLATFSEPAPVGTVGKTELLSGADADREWVVIWNATYDLPNGSTREIGARALVGPRQNAPGVPLDNAWKTRLSVGFIFVMAGAFSGRFNARLGLVAIPALAGILWYIDWLPARVGAGVILAALTLAAMVEVRGAGT